MLDSSSPYFNLETNPDEMTTVSFCQDLDNRFTGALMPMLIPIDTQLQWQSLIEGLISNAVSIDITANLDGLYVFSWWSDAQEPNASGLLFTRLGDYTVSSNLCKVVLPKGTIGLLSLTTDSQGQRLVALAISGYVSATTGKIRADRILGALITHDGKVAKNLTDRQREDMIYFGEILNNKLNSNIELRQLVK